MTGDEVFRIITVCNHFGGPKTKGGGEPGSTKSVNEDLQIRRASHFISWKVWMYRMSESSIVGLWLSNHTLQVE